ncbi:hypothetical protein [Duganella radicis]|uniref:Uncharacterized protein n=1 Tax=Duganella radicis TaxID=551988 RepID=A0A6L6PR93_9BURK|nr:hypothetical protein [Duganella radicis]MTV41613.1 hypothetical protein [Duganella radicis]
MKPTLTVTTNREGTRIHRIIDDITYPTRKKKPQIRRDPMVEALFGAPVIAEHPTDIKEGAKSRRS